MSARTERTRVERQLQRYAHTHGDPERSGLALIPGGAARMQGFVIGRVAGILYEGISAMPHGGSDLYRPFDFDEIPVEDLSALLDEVQSRNWPDAKEGR
jgi:hypothetical protein